jgi:5-methylcytosine-specific restriction enzyme A
MLVSCSYCSGRHNRGVSCPSRPRAANRAKEENYITRFRSSRAWQIKRGEIKKRDKFLCLACFQNGRYIFDKLEIHHIRPIAKAWHLRLEASNLITLCTACHKMAENGIIKAAELKEIVKNVVTF